jgi:hypothetical protein
MNCNGTKINWQLDRKAARRNSATKEKIFYRSQT